LHYPYPLEETMPENESDRPHILVTNDDGVQSAGLLELVQALSAFAHVIIVAPDHNWSAAGHSKTMHKPLRVSPGVLADGTQALVTTGSPSDCVALALLGLVPQKPDLVVSGINQGANVGHDLTYSGTVAAAMESVIGGVSAIAISLDSYELETFDIAAAFAARLAKHILAHAGNHPLLLNVNVPAIPASELQGTQITRLGSRLYRDALIERKDPRGRSYYWIGGDPPDGVAEVGTDIGALAAGYISVTPILLDLTDYAELEALRSWEIRYPHRED
jgi:5'-nucleotidase